MIEGGVGRMSETTTPFEEAAEAYDWIEESIRYLDRHAVEQPELEELAGEVRTYGQVAWAVENPRATGEFGEYGSGRERKRVLLAWESALSAPAPGDP